jgi:hypothetical protein
VFGWRVAMHRGAAEFSTLAGAGTGGFTLRGSGTATVTTPGTTIYNTSVGIIGVRR